MAQFNQKTPHNSAAEKLLLGSVLLDPAKIASVATILKPEDFWSPKHEAIWKAMLELFQQGKPIDISTLSPYMVNEDQSSSYLAGLLMETPHSMAIESHATQIKAEARRRSILKAGRQIVSSVYEERDATLAESKAKEILLDAIGSADTGDNLVTPAAQAAILKKYFTEKNQTDLSVVPTGFPTMDNLMGGGLRRGDLVTLAARTTIGKSTFAENIAEYVSRNGGLVLFVSIEMTPEQMLYRYAVRSGALSKSALEFGVEEGADAAALDNLANARAVLPFHLLDAPSSTTTTVRAAMSRMQMQEGPLSLVVIDYLQLLKDRTREEERLNIGAITSTLKMMAREFHVPMLLLSQLNRQIEMRGGEPQLSDLRESGRIEEDSDVVIMLWRVDKADSLGNQTHGKIEKNRQGATGRLPLAFHAPSFKFVERHTTVPASPGTLAPEPGNEANEDE